MPLSGTNFGVDFNPTVDRLRVISDNGQNLRVNVDTGAVMDPVASLPPTPPPGVVGAAYTNNDGSADTGTTLFVLYTVSDQVFVQAPPNAGSLTGNLLVDTATDIGFDIYSGLRDGGTVQNFAYASYARGSRKALYRINLLTGRGSAVGNFDATDDVVDVAIPHRQP